MSPEQLSAVTPEQRLKWKLDESEERVSVLEEEVRELKSKLQGMEWQAGQGQEIMAAFEAFRKVLNFADRDHDHDRHYVAKDNGVYY